MTYVPNGGAKMELDRQRRAAEERRKFNVYSPVPPPPAARGKGLSKEVWLLLAFSLFIFILMAALSAHSGAPRFF